ncbi:ATP-binding protein [Sphingomonas montanisoli]|uniref:histidine kinase n=1 Tax=Sphingomonas montanisoli TaxID=2606412 RepID=A0A5D9CA83_9SPHN|nr:ATP-binding protein [Sphingomonas montanisoli]TZG28609.1 response regulator [Sphingomonas montanisoli]
MAGSDVGLASQSMRVGFLRLLALLLAVALASTAILVGSAEYFARDQAKRQMVETARALSRVLDGDFARHEAMLRALAQSPSVAAHDWDAVDAQARAVLRNPDAWIVVGDRGGRQLVNTKLARGAILPAGKDPGWIWPILDRAQTHLCNLTHGLVERDIICVDVPIMEDGRAAYYMSVIMRPRALQPLFQRQRLPSDWYGSILDTKLALVWRSRDATKFVGHSAADEAKKALLASDEGVIAATSLDGVKTYAAYSRSPVSRWTFFIAAPREQLDSGIWSTLILAAIVVVLLMLVGGFVAYRWGQRASRGVEAVAHSAKALGAREPFVAPATRIAELDAIGVALAEADQHLRERDQALAALNTSLSQRVEEALAERERVLAQLHEAQKLETLGRLTGGVAHDFNNLLAPVMGALDLLQLRHGTDPKSGRLIAAALASTERAKTLVARLLAFARRQSLQPRPVDLGALVHGMSDLLQRSLGSTIEVQIESPKTPAVALVDPNQLELALLNLAINARDAMPEGGPLLFRVIDETEDFVRIEVIDGGEGMDDATLARAIEPFFTTKEQGRGTGLGLSMVDGLAAQSGGSFTLSSRIGAGTIATLRFPRAQLLEASPASAELIPDLTEPGRVLLVDDEEMVRRGSAELLEGLGYQTVQASSGAEALRKIAEGPAFDLLISDYLMPGMNGAVLIAEARRIMPKVPVVLVTGYAAPDLDLPGISILAKPFRQRDLSMSISEARNLAAGL